MVSVLTETPTYTLDGWTGNATDAYGVDWIVTEETGWSDGAPVRLSVADREGTDGGISGPVLRGAAIISLKGVAMAPDRATMLAAKDRWRTIARGPAPAGYTLTVAEEHLTRQATVKLSDAPKARDFNSRNFAWEIILRADDPLRYGTTPITVSTGLPAASETGMTFPLTFPLTFGGAGTGGVLLLNNAGTAASYPVLTIYGPVTNPSVQNLATNRIVEFGLTLAADESLVVDMAAKTVLLNGSANRRNALLASSSWWAIEPGSNEIRFRAASFTAAQLSITYRPAWM